MVLIKHGKTEMKNGNEKNGNEKTEMKNGNEKNGNEKTERKQKKTEISNMFRIRYVTGMAGARYGGGLLGDLPEIWPHF